MTPPTLAVTGGTGFVGAHLLHRALRGGWRVRALTRRPRPPQSGIDWVEGTLDDRSALERLVAEADAVIHVAGAINAPDRAGFAHANVHGTLNLIEAALRAGPRRFVHVSSLAAREPDLSDYGWSKKRGEAIVAASPLRWTTVRPPGVYGPGDRETLELFRMAKRGIVVLPPAGRSSWLEVGDLCRLLVALARDGEAVGEVIEPDDGRDGGWAHAAFAAELGRALGRNRGVRSVHASPKLLRLAARADGFVRRGRAKLTPDRARYLAHSNWSADPARRPPAVLWTPQVETAAGLAKTAAWYKAQGWL